MVAKSLFSVEDISARLNDNQDTFSIKHGSSSPYKTLNQCTRIPQFEICENSWELDDSISTIEAPILTKMAALYERSVEIRSYVLIYLLNDLYYNFFIINIQVCSLIYRIGQSCLLQRVYR